jgi:hypothetical protein
MRYIEIDNIEFETAAGDIVLVKDIREIPDYNILVNYKYQGEDLDELISKVQYYGDGAESETYTMVEANKIILDESDYKLADIRQLIIPAL